MARANFLQDILDSITPERQAEINAMLDEQRKWMDEHPNYNERYGTDKSFFLEEIRAKGFNPIGITVMIAEETIIFETKEETDAAAKMFLPEGWWYSIDDWGKTRSEYIDKFYKDNTSKAPIVYCLDKKFKNILK
jgi:hypothetical protein